MADSGRSSQGTSWTDFGMAPSCPDPLDDRACADHNGPRGRTRYQTGEVEEVTEGVGSASSDPTPVQVSDPTLLETKSRKDNLYGTEE